MRREFDNIQLIDRVENWKRVVENNSYIALKNNASIFVYFETAEYKLLIFNKDQFFQVDGDFIIYDELTVKDGII